MRMIFASQKAAFLKLWASRVFGGRQSKKQPQTSNPKNNKSPKKVKNTKEIMSQETRKAKDDERTRLKNNLNLKYQ